MAQTQTRDWSGREPLRYTDPDLIVLDKRFEKYVIGNTPLQRIWTGAMWAEGPAWNGVGRYLLWSDIPSNRQIRWMEEDGHTSVFRAPSDYSNGNTFDFEGRQISCEHAGRRVARYEHNGQVTALAERYNGKPLNSPNDVVVHPDGGVWFTDPPYGILGNYEGFKATSELKNAVYRVDPHTARVEMVTDQFDGPNGLCFSPDYKKIYICDTGAPRNVQVFDLDGVKLRNGRVFTDMKLGEKSGIADGIRADADGNIWAGSSGGPGYDGVQVFSPAGQRIGMIVLPEICANLCFGGPKRNRLYMAASQSLYSVYVGVQGAHIC
jgi:gluconolactonase